MIRVYLDWNIITELKRSDDGKYGDLKKKIEKYNAAIMYPFSNYHVEDLIKNNKSPEKIEKYVKPGLEFLRELSKEHFLGVDKDGSILVQIGNPLEFLDNIQEENIEDVLNLERLMASMDDLAIGDNKIEYGTLLKSIYKLQPIPEHIKTLQDKSFAKKIFPNIDDAENMWDIISGYSNFIKGMFVDKNHLKDLRYEIQRTSLVQDVNRGNWDPKIVMKNLNQSFAQRGLLNTFYELLESSKIENGNKNIPRWTYFTKAYLMLDLFGYKSDKLNKPSNTFLNITNDANHSYIGAHCDFIVSDDENLIAKSKVLYHEFNIDTVVLNGDEFKDMIDNIIHHPIGDIQSILDIAIGFLNPNFIFTDPLQKDIIDNKYKVFKLPFFYFNYFNYLIFYEEEGLLILQFRRVFKNYSNFVYFTDTKQLLQDVFNCLGLTHDGKDISYVENDFVYNTNKEEKNLIWAFPKVYFILEKELDFNRESFKIIIETK